MTSSNRWICDSETQPISGRCFVETVGISIQETRAQLLLKIQMSELEFVVFDVQATPETVLLWGHWLETSEIQGYCCSRPFERWITLPHAVYPETLWIETKPNAQELSIQLAKQFTLEQDTESAFSIQFNLN